MARSICRLGGYGLEYMARSICRLGGYGLEDMGRSIWTGGYGLEDMARSICRLTRLGGYGLEYMGRSICRLGRYRLEDMGWSILCKLQIFLHPLPLQFQSVRLWSSTMPKGDVPDRAPTKFLPRHTRLIP